MARSARNDKALADHAARAVHLHAFEPTASVLDMVRKEAGGCDCLLGFKMCPPGDGGTGSGMDLC